MMGDMYSAPQCPYIIEGKHIRTDGSVKNKVTGTTMAALIKDAEGKPVSPWSSPFQAACHLLGLARKDISFKKSVQRGNALEARIIKYAGEKWPECGTFLAAEEVFAKREGSHDDWAQDFEDDVFGGHIDGIVMAEDGDYILEIKTTINKDAWENGVPEYYYWQTAIYNEFLTKKNKVYFVMGLANEHTDRDPASWIPNEDNCFKYEKAIDSDDVKVKIAEIREWYASYILNGITPDYDPDNPGDVELYNHLLAYTADENDTQAALDNIAKAQAELDQIKAEYGFNVREKYLKQLKDDLKTKLLANSLTSMGSTNGAYNASIIVKEDAFDWDEAKMVADGIDPMKYKKFKTTYTLYVRPNKKK